VLVLIPVIAVARIAVGIFLAYRADRVAEDQRTFFELPGIGRVTSTDDQFWEGEVDGVPFDIRTPGGRPSHTDAERVLALLAELPHILSQAALFLADDPSFQELGADAEGIACVGLSVEQSDSYSIGISHPADPEFLFEVDFRENRPVAVTVMH
jgi:hypothetical protein